MKPTNYHLFDFLDFDPDLSRDESLWKAYKPTSVYEKDGDICINVPFQKQVLSNDMAPDTAFPREEYTLVSILALGVGMVGSGKKVYLPVVSQREDGAESTTKVNNSEEGIAREYDEEEVCQEIENQLGVVPVRFGYQPQGMQLQEYWIKKDDKEATLQYVYNDKQIYVYISKDSTESSINFKIDGEEEKTIQIESMSMTIPVYQYRDSDGNMYFQTSFEYLNTYYSISAMLEENEFIKIIENIIIKNV